MKKSISVLTAFLLIWTFSCMKKVNVEEEKKAIIAAVEEETAAFYSGDLNRWSSCFLQDSTFFSAGASKSNSEYYSGWESYLANNKQIVESKMELKKETKTPIRIKIYGETAFIVFDNERFNNKGETDEKATAASLLEKHDGKWKIVYSNYISDFGYYQPDGFLINSLNYAKSSGKTVEDFAAFTGDQYKTFWTGGYDGLVNGILFYWGAVVPQNDLRILERDGNHIVFSVNNVFTGLKSTPQFNVTYEDYLTCHDVMFKKIADYVGANYNQETTPDGLKITITKM